MLSWFFSTFCLSLGLRGYQAEWEVRWSYQSLTLQPRQWHLLVYLNIFHWWPTAYTQDKCYDYTNTRTSPRSITESCAYLNRQCNMIQLEWSRLLAVMTEQSSTSPAGTQAGSQACITCKKSHLMPLTSSNLLLSLDVSLHTWTHFNFQTHSALPILFHTSYNKKHPAVQCHHRGAVWLEIHIQGNIPPLPI